MKGDKKTGLPVNTPINNIPEERAQVGRIQIIELIFFYISSY
jgi:hypothetical protein